MTILVINDLSISKALNQAELRKGCGRINAARKPAERIGLDGGYTPIEVIGNPPLAGC